jgi:hypothetical protein
MGVDYSFIIGAYAECKNSKVMVEKTKIQCAKCKTSRNAILGEFCSKCGCAFVNFTSLVEQKAVDASDVSEAIDEALTYNNVTVWWANRRSSSIHYDRYKDACAVAYPLTKPAEDMAIFEKQFAKEIEILREEYGSENVALRWGTI